MTRLGGVSVLLGTALTVLACDNGVCQLDDQVAQREFAKTLRCGTLPLTASDDQRAQGQRCVLDALNAGSPFSWTVSLQGTDSKVAYAYLGTGVGSEVSLLLYDSNFSSFSSKGGGAIAQQKCRSLSATADCKPSTTSTCLECIDAAEASKVCQE